MSKNKWNARSMEKCKSKFVVGEKVLCFEPDQTKARVLYDAKIVDADFVKDGKAKKEVEYKIHFQGWNSTWDRWANESYVLKDTEENRKLQRKLAKKAIKMLRSTNRKKVYLPGVKKVIKNCSDPLSDTDSSSDSGSNDDLQNSDDDVLAPAVKRRRKKSSASVSKQSEDSFAPVGDPGVAEDAASTSSGQRRCPILDIPFNLVKRLEEDNTMIKKRNKLVELPAKLNIVQLFENYAKYFALHVAKLPSSEKMMKTGAPSTDVIPPEKNLNLCKETCQELRVLFEFILPVVLLYNSEQDQYKKLSSRAKLCQSSGKARCVEGSLDVRAGSTRDEQQAAGDVNDFGMKKETTPLKKKSMTSKQTKLSPHHRKTAEEQIIEETHTYLIPHQPNLDRTGLASDAHGRRRSSRLSQHLLSPSPSSDTMVRSPLSSTSEESTAQSKVPDIPVYNDTLVFLRAPHNHTHGVRRDKGSKSPLPLFFKEDDRYSCSSSTISLNQMCQDVYVGSAGDDVKKAVQLAQTWKFCLFPRDYEPPDGASVPLSLIYGIQHLLRLFVKLPQVFSKMEFPDYKLKIIYKHLHSLLKFLADYENEIYSLSGSYVSAS